jgi:hypothetical protein
MHIVQSLSRHRETQRLYGRIRKSLGLTHKTELLRAFWISTYEIELEHPELAGMPKALEKIGNQLSGTTADQDLHKARH